ncbi:MAG: O-antigen ligase family protein [Gammaproteobacteria bacterium]
MSESVIIKKSPSYSPSQTGEDGDIKANFVLLFLIFLIPLQNIYISRLPSLGGGLNLLNICFLFSFIIWKTRSDLNIKTPTPLNKPIVFSMLSLLLALFMHNVTLGVLPPILLTNVKDVLLAPFLFFLTLNCVRDRKGIVLTLGATILPLLYMFRVFFAQHSAVNSYHYDHDLRISGTFTLLGSNEIATFYSAYTFVLIALYFFIKTTKVRLILGFLILLNIYSLVYSYSRGAYLGFLLAIIAILWHTRRKLVFMLIPAMFIFGGVMLNFLPESVQERFESTFEDESERDESAQSRFVFWELAMEQFWESPVIGHGYLTFMERNPAKLDTHNYYLKLLAEQGIIGFIIFVIILWRAAKVGKNLYDESDDPLYKALGIGLFGVVVSLAAGNIFGDRFTHYPLSAYFYVYLAIALRALIITRENSPTSGIILRRF